MHFIQSLDQFLFLWINTTFTNSAFDFIFPAITDLHKTETFKFFLVPALLLSSIYFLRWKGLIISLGMAISLGLGDKLGSLGKHYWQRARPFETIAEAIQRSPAGGYAFPSNHALNMFCLAFFVAPLFPKARWPLLTLAFLVAYSRVYNGVHYPMDVLVGGTFGALIGTSGAEVTKKMLRKIDERNNAKRSEHHG